MQALGKVRPLSFDGGVGAAPLAVSAATPWIGVPFELHATRPVEGDRDSGPPAGEQSALVVIEGSMDIVLRERGRDVRYRTSPGSLSLHAHDERPVLRRTGSGKIMRAHPQTCTSACCRRLPRASRISRRRRRRDDPRARDRNVTELLRRTQRRAVAGPVSPSCVRMERLPAHRFECAAAVGDQNAGSRATCKLASRRLP